MLEVTFLGWIVIVSGIVFGFLMIDTSASNKVRQVISCQFNKIIPDPETTASKDLIVILIPIFAYCIIIGLAVVAVLHSFSS